MPRSRQDIIDDLTEEKGVVRQLIDEGTPGNLNPYVSDNLGRLAQMTESGFFDGPTLSRVHKGLLLLQQHEMARGRHEEYIEVLQARIDDLRKG